MCIALFLCNFVVKHFFSALEIIIIIIINIEEVTANLI